MKMKKTAISLFLAVSFSHMTAHADELRRPDDWIALQVNDQILTAGEVRRYIDTVVISSDLHRALFEEANRDFTAYREKENALIDELFVPTLDRLAVVRILQGEATKKTERQFFAITKKQMKDVIEQNIRKALNKFRQNGESLTEARDAFIEDLKNNGAPYDSSAPSTDVYNNWVQRISNRLREEYRQHEASRFLCSQGNCGSGTPMEALIKRRSALEGSNFVTLRPSANTEIKQKDVFERLVSMKQTDLTVAASSKLIDGIKSFFYLGKIVNDKIELLHINDWNLTGPIGSAMGFPRTDDSGRTSGFVLTLSRTGENGSLSIQYENWLFTERLPDLGKKWRQVLEEENTLRVVSRHFLDEKGNKWVLIGVSGTYRSQREGLGALIQNYFHQLSSNRVQLNVERNGSDLFFQGMFGAGGKYSIIDKPYMDLVISGESYVAPSAGNFSQSNITVKPSMDLSFYAQDKSLPTFRIGLFSEIRTRANGQIDTVFGGRITAGVIIKKVQIEAGLYVVRWDGEMDRRYEHGASWTTGIIVMVSHAPDPKKVVEYEL